MNKFRSLLIFVLVLVPSIVRADFVTSNTSLPATKSNLRPIPVGADATKYIQASDYNALMSAAISLRTAIVNGGYHGLMALATDPLPVNATNYLWLQSGGKLHFFRSIDGLIPYGPVTAKGDLLSYGGSNFVVRTVGTNGQCLQADSGQSSGLAWGSCGVGNTITAPLAINDTVSPQVGGAFNVKDFSGNILLNILNTGSGSPRVDIGKSGNGTMSAYNDGVYLLSNDGVSAINVQGSSGGDDITIQGGFPISCSATFDNDGITLDGSVNFNDHTIGQNNVHRITIPDVTDSMAVLGTAQTFSADQEFSSNILVDGETDTGVLVCTQNALGTTQTSGITVQNTTAASVGAQQYSPTLDLSGKGWATGGGGSSQVVKWLMQSRPIQGAASPDVWLDFLQSVNGSSPARALSFFYAGSISGILSSDLGMSILTNNAAGAYSGFEITATQLKFDVGGSLFSTLNSGGLNFNVNNAGILNSTSTRGVLLTTSDTTAALVYGGDIRPYAAGLDNGQPGNPWRGTYSTTYDGTQASIATAQTAGLSLTNPTAAALGAQQYSPALVLTGQGWATGSGGSSQAVQWLMQTRSIQGSSAPSGNFDFYRSINGVSATRALSLQTDDTASTTISTPYANLALTTNDTSGGTTSAYVSMNYAGLIIYLNNQTSWYQFLLAAFKPSNVGTDLGTGLLPWLTTYTNMLGSVQNGGLPTCAIDTGAGAGSCSLLTDSTDMVGTVRVTAGAGPASGGATIVTVTFKASNGAYATAPRCFINGAGSTTHALVAGQFGVTQASGTTALFVLTNDSAVPLVNGTVYDVNYFCAK